jgi:uncharacterized protein YndB with AHSA1/START domain
MSNRTVVHDSFVLERSYAHPVARVFGAWSDGKAKQQWFGADEVSTEKYELDFRVGGTERVTAKGPDGATYTYDANYMDIVENSRIVTSYEMTMDGRRISVSVATVEFVADGDSTRLIMTEQGAFLDGLDTNEQRREGTEAFLDALANFLG